jgi:TetR/AcrR family transcriptional regulator, transcriptional repressor for nem operon
MAAKHEAEEHIAVGEGRVAVCLFPTTEVAWVITCALEPDTSSAVHEAVRSGAPFATSGSHAVKKRAGAGSTCARPRRDSIPTGWYTNVPRRAATHPIVRQRLLDAARELMLRDGFAATGLAEICAAAGVTKGSFFHYFESKEAVGAATLERFGADLGSEFAAAPFHGEADPLTRVEAYIDFTIDICRSSVLRQGCLVGMLAQELGATHSAMREACQVIFSGWAESFADQLTAAKLAYTPDASFDPHSLAAHFIAVVEGALILAKTSAERDVVEHQLEHFRAYVRCLLGQQASRFQGV